VFEGMVYFAFIGPGGPEFLLVMLVLIMMFGAKDAPRILRKLNEMFNQIRNTADGFKREVMYGDLKSHTPNETSIDDDPGYDDDDYDYGEEDFDIDESDTLENYTDESCPEEAHDADESGGEERDADKT